jgi:hypothetical protein
MNLQKHLSIIVVLVALVGIYLALTYFSPESIDQREVDFYRSLALEAGQAIENDWDQTLLEFENTKPAVQKSLNVDLKWVEQKKAFILADVNSLELSEQSRTAARRMLALSLINKYIIILNMQVLETGTDISVMELEEQLKQTKRGMEFFDFDWQETAGFTEQEINDEASVYMNDFWGHRLVRIMKADKKEVWRVETIKLIELNRLLNSIETV